MTTAASTVSHPPGWADEELLPWPKPDNSANAAIDLAQRGLSSAGWAVVEIAAPDEAEDPRAARRASQVLGGLGTPIRIFAGQPTWRALRSDPQRPAGSSGGWGAQPTHMDFVNAQFPPELVCLYCYRDDPGGGGASVLSPVAVTERLSTDDLQALARHVYRDGVVRDLCHVGVDINPFAVWNPGERFTVRWSGKLVGSVTGPAEREALQRMSALLGEAEQELRLRPGEMLVIDQHRVVHGRRALGTLQDAAEAGTARLLMHAFGRCESSTEAQ